MEEYKFSDSEGVTPPAPPPPPESPVASFSWPSVLAHGKNIAKKIFPAVSLVVVIFVAYKIMDIYNAHKNTEYQQQNNPVASSQSLLAPAPAPAAVIAPVVSDEVKDQINALQQEVANLEQRIQGGQDQVVKVQQAVDSVNQNIGVLANSVQGLVSDIQKLQQAPAPVVDPAKNTNKKKKIKAQQPASSVYHIRAIVDGRVWIDSNRGGKSYTLRVGDKLDGYGTVDVISPKDGLVLMSDGSYIQYGANDI